MNNSLFSLYKNSLSGLSRDIWLLSFVMLINRSGAMVVPFLSIYLNQKLGYSLGDCGLIMACYGMGAVLGVMSGGFLTDKLGFYKVQLFSLLLTSLTFFAVMYCKTFLLLCGGFFLISFFADHFRPANITAIETFSSKENLVRSITLVRLAINLGFSFGPFIGGLAIAFLDYDWLFILNGGSIFIAFVLFYFLFRDKQHRVVVKDSKEEKADRLPWFDKDYMLFLLSYTFIAFVFLQLIYTYPLALKLDFLFNESVIGIYMALNGIIIFLVEMPLIYTLEKKYKALPMVLIGSFLVGLAFLSLAIIPNPHLAAIVFTLLITTGEMICFPFANMFALSFSNDKNRGKYMGLFTMTFAIASIVSPLGGMQITEFFGFNILWVSCFLLVCIALLLMYLVRPKKDVQQSLPN